MDKLKQLHEVLDGHTRLLIIPHNDPDPDAIAASLGLRYLAAQLYGIEAEIRYSGIIGRAENKALVRYLGNPLKKLNKTSVRSGIPIALIDSQPGTGNNPIPPDIHPTIVIDHHIPKELNSQAKFSDIRTDVGASATIVTEYLQAGEIALPPTLATALFYGIKTDTMGLGRGASPADVAAYFYLQPKIDVESLVQIERAQVPDTYFKSLNTALQATQVYDNLVITYLGPVKYPDLGAEIADLLLRLEDVKWVICMGVFEGDLFLSVRSRSRQIGAGNLVQQVVGNLGSAGGHGTMAGGQIPIGDRDPRQIADQLRTSALIYLKGSSSQVGKPLI
jgi:nanoRNase/pAp phosphatase (c-di-AMP/oligoRNAs hydrolase)